MRINVSIWLTFDYEILIEITWIGVGERERESKIKSAT